jgi:hypothetical protein
VLPVGIGLRDPRSQKRDLGHPSISPFAFAEGTSFVISLPTRLSESAAPRDDKKERVVTRKGRLLNRGIFSNLIWTSLKFSRPRSTSSGQALRDLFCNR